jgi:hypothetical protein
VSSPAQDSAQAAQQEQLSGTFADTQTEVSNLGSTLSSADDSFAALDLTASDAVSAIAGLSKSADSTESAFSKLFSSVSMVSGYSIGGGGNANGWITQAFGFLSKFISGSGGTSSSGSAGADVGGGSLDASGIDAGATGVADTAGSVAVDAAATDASSLFLLAHSGWAPGDAMKGGSAPAGLFANAPRFHSGIGPHERAAVILKNESVFTQGQMRGMAPLSRIQDALAGTPAYRDSEGGGGRTVNVYNNFQVPASIDKRSINQIANEAGRSISMASRNQ